MSACACRPGAGSEAGVGWTYAAAAAAGASVTLITREEYRADIDRELSQHPTLALQAIYLAVPRFAESLRGKNLGCYIHHFVWERMVAKKARLLSEEHGFDVVHHITLGMDWMPAGVLRAGAKTKIWGPVGGATKAPWRYWRFLGARGAVDELLRATSGAIGRRTFGRAAARKSTIVLAQNEETAEFFRRRGAVVEVHPHCRISPATLPTVADRILEEANTSQTMVCVGRLLPWKGLDLALQVLADPRLQEWRLELFGAGRDERRLRRRASALGVTDRVVFRGQTCRDAVIAAVAEARLLLHPSLHESAALAVAEARSVGTPVVALDQGGARLVVGPGDGVLVSGSACPKAAFVDAILRVPDHEVSTAWLTDRLPLELTQLYDSGGQETEGRSAWD